MKIQNKIIAVWMLFLCGIMVNSEVMAQSIDEWNTINNPPKQVNKKPIIRKSQKGAPDITNRLIVGTSQNVNDPTGTSHDIFAIDVNLDSSESILSDHAFWGATADPRNQRILFTQASGLTDPGGGGDNLYEIPYAGSAPNLIGRIVNETGEGVRIDGLALSNGQLYGYNAGNDELSGFYSIDLQTLEATQVTNTPDSISGLDADPETCIIYGTNDTTGQVVTIDTAGNITNLVAYPIGIIDIDGIAVGEGYAYLITDQAQNFPVLNLTTLSYEPSLTSPFTNTDIFSAGALALPATTSEIIFKSGFEIETCQNF